MTVAEALGQQNLDRLTDERRARVRLVLGQDDLPIADARKLLGEAALLGLSITDAVQLTAPDAALADCLGVGAVFPTGSKSDATLTGLALVEAARTAAEANSALAPSMGRAPIIAIGGITAENAGRAVLAGADVVAVISAITAARDPARAAADLLTAVRAERAHPEPSRSRRATRAIR